MATHAGFRVARVPVFLCEDVAHFHCNLNSEVTPEEVLPQRTMAGIFAAYVD